MSTVGFSVRRLDCVEPEVLVDGTTGIYVEASLTEEQMFHAIQVFRGEVVEKTWDSWLARIAEEAL